MHGHILVHYKCFLLLWSQHSGGPAGGDSAFQSRLATEWSPGHPHSPSSPSMSKQVCLPLYKRSLCNRNVICHSQLLDLVDGLFDGAIRYCPWAGLQINGILPLALSSPGCRLQPCATMSSYFMQFLPKLERLYQFVFPLTSRGSFPYVHVFLCFCCIAIGQKHCFLF